MAESVPGAAGGLAPQRSAGAAEPARPSRLGVDYVGLLTTLLIAAVVVASIDAASGSTHRDGPVVDAMQDALGLSILLVMALTPVWLLYEGALVLAARFVPRSSLRAAAITLAVLLWLVAVYGMLLDPDDQRSVPNLLGIAALGVVHGLVVRLPGEPLRTRARVLALIPLGIAVGIVAVLAIAYAL